MTKDDKSKRVTDVTPGTNLREGQEENAAASTESWVTILPPGDHYETSPYGTLHTRVPTDVRSVYASTAAAFRETAEQDAVLGLEETFTTLASPVLYALAHDAEPVAPRVGVSNVHESTLKALAGYEWERRKAVYEEDRADKAERHVNRRWLIGSFIGAPVLLVLGAILNALLS